MKHRPRSFATLLWSMRASTMFMEKVDLEVEEAMNRARKVDDSTRRTICTTGTTPGLSCVQLPPHLVEAGYYVVAHRPPREDEVFVWITKKKTIVGRWTSSNPMRTRSKNVYIVSNVYDIADKVCFELETTVDD